jgi:cytochrome oxidase assembly protein ShyY1
VTESTHPPPKDPFDLWLELVVLILVAPLIALIGGTWQLAKRALRRFAEARQRQASTQNKTIS